MALPSLYSSTCEEEAWRLEHRRANRTSFRHAIASLGWAHLASNSSYNALTCFATLRERSPKRTMRGVRCHSAFKFAPASASNSDPFGRRVLAVALAPSELVGVAETVRARAA